MLATVKDGLVWIASGLVMLVAFNYILSVGQQYQLRAAFPGVQATAEAPTPARPIKAAAMH